MKTEEAEKPFDERAVYGDFHVIKLDGLFHVVFRPDADPEWFRIIASFFTYERAYSYCDIERVSCFQDRIHGPDSHTGEEEVAGLRAPPVHLVPLSAQEEPDGVRELVRNVYDADEHVAPHPAEDFNDQPIGLEAPKEYHDRQFAEAVAKAADKPTCAECGKPRHPSSGRLCRDCYRVTPADGDAPLTPNQTKVLKYFREAANPLHLVSATYRQIAEGSQIVKTSCPGVIESLERRGLIEVRERGKPGRECVFKLTDLALEAAA